MAPRPWSIRLLFRETARADGDALWLLEMSGLVPVKSTTNPGLPLDRLDRVGAEDAVVRLGRRLLEL